MEKKTDQRTRLTQMLIRKALTALLGQKPLQSISVTELCQLAGINRGTFYTHYTDIYDLMNRMEEEMLLEFQQALAPMLDAGEGECSLLRITAGTFQCIKNNADLCTVTLGPYGDKEFASRLLAVGREQCLSRYSQYFEQASPEKLDYYYAFVSAGCIGLLEKWLGSGMTVPAEEMARMAEGIMLGGIRFLYE